MTFTIDGNLLSNLAGLASPGAAIGIGIVILFMLAMNSLARWGDANNNRTDQSAEKQGSSMVWILVIVIVAVSICYCK